MYSFSSAVFNDESDVDKIADFLQEENLQQIENSLKLLPQGVGSPLQEAVEKLEKRWGKTFQQEEKEKENLDLRREFAYLFLTPHGVSPFESIYRGKKKLLMDKPWEEVRKFYRRLGLQKDKAQMHPEDHIAVELGLMAALSYISGRYLLEENDKELRAKERKQMLEVQFTFLEQHLSQWAPQLCNDIMEKTRHPFYDSVARLTAELIHADLLCLKAFFTDDKTTSEGR